MQNIAKSAKQMTSTSFAVAINFAEVLFMLLSKRKEHSSSQHCI